MIVFPNCKINLGLHVTRKRPDGYHDLETVFYPVTFCDALEVVNAGSQNLDEITMTTTGAAINTKPEDNICVKAYHLLKKDFPELPGIEIYLHKVIPAGAGLGGGSADGAFMLRLLNEKFQLHLAAEQLISYALKLGSDCPFFIINKPCFATGRGERLEEIKPECTGYKLLLVNPGIHIHTGRAFERITPSPPRKSIKEIVQQPAASWKDELINDFEAVVFQQYPEIHNIKKALYDAGALYASMSGSGSTVFAFFENEIPDGLNFPGSYMQVKI